jgi:hypothetical protein
LPDYYPQAQAFQELTLQTFMALLDMAGLYFEAFYLADADGPATDETHSRRLVDMAYAAGYMLRTKFAGWKQFCETLSVPPDLCWSVLPGYDRFQRALKMSEHSAFDANGFDRWRERIRPTDAPTGAMPPFTAQAEAEKTAAAFRDRVKRWDG